MEKRVAQVDFSGVLFEQVRFRGARLRNVDLTEATIEGDVDGLVINGVEVAGLINDELNRQYPERAKMAPTDPAGFREGWDVVERLWAATTEQALKLPENALHESVDGEWSFVQTLRHLVFATDGWLARAVLGNPSPWDPLDLPWDGMTPTPGVPWDRDVRAPLDEVLALRADRMALVRRYVDRVTEADLASDTEPTDVPGWPPAGDSFPVIECLHILYNEEWQHRLYAERDLAVLEAKHR